MEQLLTNAKERMQKAADNLGSSLTSIRTGRANASILDHVMFEYYGSLTPINQVASIQVIEGYRASYFHFGYGAGTAERWNVHPVKCSYADRRAS